MPRVMTLVMTWVMTLASDAPTDRFGQTIRSVSDKEWVCLVMAKNYRTQNSSVALFFTFFTCFTQYFNAENRFSSKSHHDTHLINACNYTH